MTRAPETPGMPGDCPETGFDRTVPGRPRRPRSRSLRTIRRAACPQAAVPVCDKEKSLADRCRGRRPRRLAEGSRPLPTMQTVKGDTVARLRAGHARPLRTAVKIYAREGQGRAAARPYGWRKVRGQGCRELRPRRPAEGSRPLPTMQTGKGDTMARLRAGHARPLRTAVSGSGGSGELPSLRWRKARRR